MPQERSKIPKQRPSASADAALRAEIERVSRMTVEERVREALAMKDYLAWFPTESIHPPVNEER